MYKALMRLYASIFKTPTKEVTHAFRVKEEMPGETDSGTTPKTNPRGRCPITGKKIP
jgi:hypothetical protein